MPPECPGCGIHHMRGEPCQSRKPKKINVPPRRMGPLQVVAICNSGVECRCVRNYQEVGDPCPDCVGGTLVRCMYSMDGWTEKETDFIYKSAALYKTHNEKLEELEKEKEDKPND